MFLLLCLTFAADVPLRDTIDRELAAAWKREKITPAVPADDAAFLRRVTLDLVGTVPTYEEVSAFLADRSADRRGKAIERLLADPRFAAHQANVWDLVLFGRNPPGYDEVRKREGFRPWLTGQFAKNVPYDRIVRDLLLAEEKGTEWFLVQHRGKPDDLTEAITRTFLGTQLQCARCHDHPFVKDLTQRDFYGMAGFVVRLVVLEGTEGGKRRYRIGEKSSGEVLFTGSAKEARPGQKGEPVKPKFLGGEPLAEPPLPKDFKEPNYRGAKTLPKPAFSRREKLLAWMTAPENPFFARAAANRVWAQFMGRGLVHPVDDFGSKNEPTVPALLDALTKQFVADGLDLKKLIREIVSSKAYQLSGKGPVTDALPKFHERARVRPLSAEELLAAMRTVNAFDTTGGRPPGAIEEYFRRYFGTPTNGLGEFQGGLWEHLFLNNSPQVRELIRRRKGNLADQVLTMTDPWEKRVDRLYLSVLSRPPSEAERKKVVEYLKAEPKADQLVEEVIWVLMNSAGFRFNH